MGELGGFDAVAVQAHPDVEYVNHVHHAGNSSGIVDGAASSRQYAPGFMTDLMAKDLALAVNAAREKRVPVAVAAAAQQLYRMASSHGLGREDFSAVYKFLKPSSGDARYSPQTPSRPGLGSRRYRIVRLVLRVIHTIHQAMTHHRSYQIRYTGESRCPRQKWIPAFAGKARRGRRAASTE